MARPCKRKRVCCEPACSTFLPASGGSLNNPVTMTVEEYECIRLIDREAMSQADCAKQMAVARSTVQALYDSARCKVAQAILGGLCLHIAGGEYYLCDGTAGCAHCVRGEQAAVNKGV